MRRLLPLLLLGLVTACGGAHAVAPAAPAHHGRARPRDVAVVVTASVLERRGVAPTACRTLLSSAPPAGCSGVRVSGYDFRRVAGLVRFAGGWQTPVLRIEGVWAGHALRVRRAAVPHGGSTPQAPPRRCDVRATRRGLALARRIEHGRRAAQALAFGPCGRTAWMLVPYAGPRIVAALHARYGHAVVVSGWLLPVRRARAPRRPAGGEVT